jgi:adenylosuccinate synthase
MPGWKSDISGITEYNKLPSKAKDYINAVEKLTNIPISWIGTGPERESIALK